MSGDLFGSKANTVTTNGQTGPWAGAQPYLSNIYANAQSIYNRGPYQGPYITEQSPFTGYAQDLTAQKAQDPNSLVGLSQKTLGDTISGKYLDGKTNPYFEQSMNDALGQVRGQFASQYAGQAGGNLTNAGFQEALTRTLGNVATNAYSSNYARERQNQLEATQLAPSMDYANIDRLSQIGAQQEARGQAEVGAAQAAYQAPWENLNQYYQALKVGSGGTSSNQTPYFTNPTSNAIGAGLGATQLYKAMFGGSSGTTGMAGSGAPSGMGTGMDASNADSLPW